MSIFRTVAGESPFRLLAQKFCRFFGGNVEQKIYYCGCRRPHYLLGVYKAALQAIEENVSEISVIELGVAGGNGLVELQQYSAWVEAETEVKISVFGFDTGKGLPTFCGDYRDHPDQWKLEDFPMNVNELDSRLTDKTKLILGNVSETIPKFVIEEQPSPIGFISFDMDLYSSTVLSYGLLNHPKKNILRKVFLYFDDVDLDCCHKYAGELLAIHEFNESHDNMKIDRWYRAKVYSAFPERIIWERMYVAHDLDAISATILNRKVNTEFNLESI